MMQFVITRVEDQATVTLSLNHVPYTISNTDEIYTEVVAALKRGADEAEVDALVNSRKNKLEQALEIAEGFAYSGGVVTFEDEPLHPVLGEYIVSLVQEGFPITAMVAFVRNLFENPSYRAVKELYPFLMKGKNMVTEDGHFLAYKRIRADYTDVYTGKMDNSVGKTVSMRRNQVDEDSTQTCSHGLHVCSYDYLPHFSGDRVVVCKVNPRDVVSIPADYQDTKMRVCRYEVVAELEDWVSKNTLAQSSCAADPSDPDYAVFGVEVDDDGNGYNEVDAYANYTAARNEMRRIADEEGAARVRVVNKNTKAVLDCHDDGSINDSSSQDDSPGAVSLQEVNSDGSVVDIDTGIDVDDFDSELADAVHDVLTNNRVGRVIAVRVIDEHGAVLRCINFG